MIQDGEDLVDSDLEIVLEDEAEVKEDYAKNLIDGVLDKMSEGSQMTHREKKKKKKR